MDNNNRGKKASARMLRNDIKGYMFLLPSLFGFLAFIVIPVVMSLCISFTEWDGVSGLQSMTFVGLKNFIDIWKDPWFTKSLFNNFIYTGLMVPVTMSFALLFALILNGDIFARQTIRTFFFMPYISNAVAISIVWSAMLHPTKGVINNFLLSIGIENPPGWFASSQWSLITVTALGIWIELGYNIIIFMAGLQNVPKVLYEAARIDGATPWQSFIYITLPLISPTSFFLLVTNIITSFKVFTPVNLITLGGPGNSSSVLVYYLFVSAFRYYKMGYASAIAWVLFIIIFLATLLQWRGQKKWVNYT